MTDPTDARTFRLHRDLEDVRRILIGHIDATVTELQNALINVSASRIPLNSRLAEVALAELVEGDDEATVPAALVITVTAEFYGYTTDELLSPSRTKHLTQARQIAMWLCRKLTDLSLPGIGIEFDRDHTTVMHAVRKIQHEVDADPILTRQLSDLTTLIKRQAATNALRGVRDTTSRGAA